MVTGILHMWEAKGRGCDTGIVWGYAKPPSFGPDKPWIILMNLQFGHGKSTLIRSSEFIFIKTLQFIVYSLPVMDRPTLPWEGG